jgi:hypothetical protein
MIGSSSRYTAGEVLWVNTKSRGNKQTVYLNPVVLLSVPYTAVLIHETDSQQQFAYKVYRDASRWWNIADVNPQVFYPLDMIPGASLRVPS